MGFFKGKKGDITPTPSLLTGLGRINDTWLTQENGLTYSGMIWGRFLKNKVQSFTLKGYTQQLKSQLCTLLSKSES